MSHHIPDATSCSYVSDLHALHNAVSVLGALMKRLLLLASFVAGGLCFTGPASAQQPGAPSCEFAPVILSAADYLLIAPEKPSAFWRDNEGAAAAYLKMRYTPMDEATTTRFIAELSARPKPPQRIGELTLAQLDTEARRQKLEAAIKAEGFDPAMLTLGESGLRALLLDDDGAWLFAQMAARTPAENVKTLQTHYTAITGAVADVGDERLARIASEAEKAKLWKLALGFSIQQSSLNDYVAQLRRMPDDELGPAAGKPDQLRTEMIAQALARTLFRAEPLDIAIQPMEVQAVFGERPHYALQRQFGYVVGKMPEAALIMTIANQSGDQRIMSDVLPRLTADLKSGKIDPVKSPEAAVAAMAQILDAVMGKDQRLRFIKGVDGISGMRANPVELLDSAVATTALLPMFAAEAAVAVAPPEPAGLSPDFDWAAWVEVAKLQFDGKNVPPEQGLIAGWIAAGGGEYGFALDQIKTASDTKQARLAAYNLMLRMDRMCGDQLRPTSPLREDVFRFGG